MAAASCAACAAPGPFAREGASFCSGPPEEGGLVRYIVQGGRERSAAAEAAAIEASTALQTTPCECAEDLSRRPGEPCASAPVVEAISKYVEDTVGTPPPPEKSVLAAAQVLGCSSESCVLAAPRFRQHVRAHGGPSDQALDSELLHRFKPPGPRTGNQLLSNFNLDDVLQQWAVAFPGFFNLPFCMIDFAETGGSLASVDFAGVLDGREAQMLAGGGRVRRPCSTFACALNTDVSTGGGKHWVAIFGDCRGRGVWRLEYFNSAGNPPAAAVARWQEATRARLLAFRRLHPQRFGDADIETVSVTDVRHQDSQTECGVYILYYIRARLEGRPSSEFCGTRIADAAMERFRAHLYRDDSLAQDRGAL